MSHIVVLSSFYLDSASANGICAYNIVNDLKKIGHEVSVICYSENNTKYKDIYTIKITNELNKISKIKMLLIRFIKKIKLILNIWTPEINDVLVAKYLELLENINTYKSIDAIIAMYFPIESLESLYIMKQNKPNIKAIVYELDSVADGVSRVFMQNHFNKAHEKFLNYKYSMMDYIFVMNSHKNYWLKTFSNKYHSKMIVADIPVLIEKSKTVFLKSSPISLIYAGNLDKKYRSPLYLLSVLDSLEKQLEIKFTFFSKGNCESQIFKKAQKLKSILQKGYVSFNELDNEVLKSDILVSIGNSNSNSLPSKLITYISYGKPIIHFSSQRNDICKGYLKKYPLGLIVNQSQPIDQSVLMIKKFILNTKTITIDYNSINQIFYMNEPIYSAKLIDEILKK